MKNSARVWTGIGVLGALVLLAGGWFLGVSPLLQSAQSAQSSAQATQAQVDALRTSLVTLRTAAANRSALEAKAAAAEAAVPSTVAVSSFIDELNALASADDVKLSAVTPGTSTKTKGSTSTEVDLTVVGSRAASMEFLNDLQTGARAYLLTGLSGVKAGNGSSFTTSVQGVVFSLAS